MVTTKRTLAGISAAGLLVGLAAGPAQASVGEISEGSLTGDGALALSVAAPAASLGLPTGSITDQCVGIMPPLPFPISFRPQLRQAVGEPAGTTTFAFEPGSWGGDIHVDVAWRNVDTGAAGTFSGTVDASYLGMYRDVETGPGTIEWEVTRAVGNPIAGTGSQHIDFPFSTCRGSATV